jgi:hypothetical protein
MISPKSSLSSTPIFSPFGIRTTNLDWHNSSYNFLQSGIPGLLVFIFLIPWIRATVHNLYFQSKIKELYSYKIWLTTLPDVEAAASISVIARICLRLDALLFRRSLLKSYVENSSGPTTWERLVRGVIDEGGWAVSWKLGFSSQPPPARPSPEEERLHGSCRRLSPAASGGAPRQLASRRRVEWVVLLGVGDPRGFRPFLHPFF